MIFFDFPSSIRIGCGAVDALKLSFDPFRTLELIRETAPVAVERPSLRGRVPPNRGFLKARFMGSSAIERFLRRYATLVTTYRALFIVGTLTVTALFASQIPKIEVDPAPENLLSASDSEAIETQEIFAEAFGDNSRILLVLITAADVLTEPNLLYQHQLATALKAIDGVERVESITEMILPRVIDPALEPAEEEDFDLDDLEDLDSLEDEDLEDSFDPETVNLMVDIFEADPERFEGGLQVVGPRIQETLRFESITNEEGLVEDAETKIRAALDASPLLVGRLISEDSQAVAIALFLRDVEGREMPHLVRSVEEAIAALKAPDETEVRVAGLPFVRNTIAERLRTDQLVLLPATLLVCMALLYFAMRWVLGVFLPIIAVSLTLLIVLGGMAITGMQLNILNNIIPPLLIIIGITDAIHLLIRYRDELPRRGAQKLAGFHTVFILASALFFTDITTSVGLGSLYAAKAAMLRNFGIIAAIGVLVAYLITIVFVPPVMIAAKPPPLPDPKKKRSRPLETFLVIFTARVLRNPWPVLLITLGILAVSTFFAFRVRVDHALLDQFDKDDPVYVTTRLLEEKLDGIRPMEVIFETDDPELFIDPEFIAAIERVQAFAEEDSIILRTMSYPAMLRQSLTLFANDAALWEEPFRSKAQVNALVSLLERREESPIARFMTEDRTLARMQLMFRDAGAEAAIRFIDKVEAEFERELAEYPVTLRYTGDAYTGSKTQSAVVLDLLASLLAAILIIFVILTLFFRSLRLGLLSIPPNLIPLVGTLGYMAVRDIPLNMSTVIIFSISFSLAVDGSIHVLARFREEMNDGKAPASALLRAARGTGRANVISYLTLTCGFGVMLLSSFVPIRQFGELIAVTVATCMIATVFLLPALLRVFSPKQTPIELGRSDLERH